eukprot:6551093-Lingulodinium_polyedra.AAC.1
MSSTSTCPSVSPAFPERTPTLSSASRGLPRSSSPTSPRVYTDDDTGHLLDIKPAAFLPWNFDRQGLPPSDHLPLA